MLPLEASLGRQYYILRRPHSAQAVFLAPLIGSPFRGPRRGLRARAGRAYSSSSGVTGGCSQGGFLGRFAGCESIAFTGREGLAFTGREGLALTGREGLALTDRQGGLTGPGDESRVPLAVTRGRRSDVHRQ